jgi:2-polyprenyl-3-methyl-5-hydroxy-6-metoxy-1,4-benzoquinol methylase
MDYTAFSHGQILSKIWLCEELEPILHKNAKIAILGSWYNILGFMLLVRKPNYYTEILGIDIDSDAIKVADKICNAWAIGENPMIKNVNLNANTVDIKKYDVVINCSAEHMESDLWFNDLSPNTIVCLQSTNLDIKEDPWKIINPNKTMKEFAAKYPLLHTLFKDQKEFDYGTWGYSRFMIIGTK